MCRLLQERDIIVYCDLHGHSRRQNVFIYGCEQRLNTVKRLHERIFPCMLHKNAPDKVSLLFLTVIAFTSFRLQELQMHVP